MLNHFDKLNTPPKSVRQYPTLSRQIDRFTSRGFQEAKIWDLWQVWSSEDFVSGAERASLDDIEPFDEWEEFAMFGRHYFIIHASTSSKNENKCLQRRNDSVRQSSNTQVSVVKSFREPKRRFGDAFAVRNPTGDRLVINLFGLGTCGREGSCDIYSLDGQADVPLLPTIGPTPRMCHTVTDLGDYGILLVGGRSSPANALSDCWIFEKGSSCQWKPTHNLPLPLFRHSTIRLPGTHLALVAGGKTGASNISENIYVFHVSHGWLKCKILGVNPGPTFGGILCNTPNIVVRKGVYTGLIAGGIGLEGLINQRVYEWHLELKQLQVNNIPTFDGKTSILTKNLHSLKSASNLVAKKLTRQSSSHCSGQSPLNLARTHWSAGVSAKGRNHKVKPSLRSILIRRIVTT